MGPPGERTRNLAERWGGEVVRREEARGRGWMQGRLWRPACHACRPSACWRSGRQPSAQPARVSGAPRRQDGWRDGGKSLGGWRVARPCHAGGSGLKRGMPWVGLWPRRSAPG